MAKFRSLMAMVAMALCATVLTAQQDSKANDPKHMVQLQTDSGRYGVAAEQLDPKQLGVAIYPGARPVQDKDSKGAHLSLDWGQDSAHLYVQEYVTSDPPEKVLAFYRKELAKYGKVLECRGGAQVSVDSELKCDDSQHKSDDKSIELKAGTENSQHLVGVTPKEHGTDIGIVRLEKHGTM